MSYLDQRGHRVPSPTDPAQRQDLLALSLSIPSYKACASETAAAQYVSALAAAGLVASAAQPVYVWRTDLNAVRVWDGRAWAAESNLQMELSAVGDMPVGAGLSPTVQPGLIKGGRVAVSSSEVAFGNLYMPRVNFSTPFPHECVSVSITPLYGSGPAGWNFKNGRQFCVDVLDKSGFRPMLPGVTSQERHSFAWMALGY
nr:MAG TPA: putative tail fiber protein [Caudoviricetes sp.]